MCNTESVMVGLVYVTENGQTSRVIYCLILPIGLQAGTDMPFPVPIVRALSCIPPYECAAV